MRATVLVVVVACQLFLLQGAADAASTLKFLGFNPKLQGRDLDWTPPWYCHGIDCPEFELVNTTNEYEERHYKEAKWASTEVKSLFYTTAVTTGFKRLFDYISGSNEDAVKINMTAPVRVHVSAGEGPFCKSSFKVSFFVPFDHQDEPPTPTNADVFIENIPAATYYVTSFGGFVLEPLLVSKANAFFEKLKADDLDVEVGPFFSAGYDPPFRLTNRHNEIWVKRVNSTDTM